MRYFLAVITLLFITQSCFAAKTAERKAAYSTATKKRTSLLHSLFTKVNPDDASNVSTDYFEHPTLIRQDLKKNVLYYILLFQRQECKSILSTPVKAYTAVPWLNYIFIYQCLYPKHVFW